MQRHACIWVALATLSAIVAVRAGETYRTWTSVQGTTIEAQLVTNNAGSVILEKRSGEKITLNSKLLSAADQRYIEDSGSRTNAPPDPAQSLGYRDLRLHMTRENLDRLIQEEKTWTLHFTSDPKADKLTLQLGIRSSTDSKARDIGQADGKSLKWDQVHVVYRNDQVQEISLSSPTGDEAALESSVSDWAQLAVKILTAQYGKPASGPTQKFQMMASLRKMGFSEIARWKPSAEEEICVQAIGERSEQKFRAQVTYRLVKTRKPAPATGARK